MKTTLIIVILLALGVGGYAFVNRDATPTPTDETPSDEGRIRGPEDASISVGQTATIAGVAVTLNKVDDSRCPTGVQCIWAGTVTASVTLALNGETSTRDMTLDAEPVEFKGYFVSLTAALPYPKEGVMTDKKDYMLTFHVAPVIGSDGNIPANI